MAIQKYALHYGSLRLTLPYWGWNFSWNGKVHLNLQIYITCEVRISSHAMPCHAIPKVKVSRDEDAWLDENWWTENLKRQFKFVCIHLISCQVMFLSFVCCYSLPNFFVSAALSDPLRPQSVTFRVPAFLPSYHLPLSFVPFCFFLPPALQRLTHRPDQVRPRSYWSKHF